MSLARQTQILNLKKTKGKGRFRVSARIVTPKNRVTFQFASPTTDLALKPEAFVALALLPAMKTGSDLVLEAPVSPLFLKNIISIQKMLAAWAPGELRPIEVLAPIKEASTAKNPGVGCFFSGGVDSFYTFLKHKAEITHLIFLHGFDTRLEDTDLRARISAQLRKAVNHFGKEFVEIEAPYKAFLDNYTYWGLAHGAGLAASAHLLSDSIGKIYVPASHSHQTLLPWGSDPALDPLWSDEKLEFIHDGCEANRIEKCRLLARHPESLQYLRVCYKNTGGAYNCGECEKCVRTMINLTVAGAMDRCRVFTKPLQPELIPQLLMKSKSTRSFAFENLEALKAVQNGSPLTIALEACIERNLPRQFIPGAL